MVKILWAGVVVLSLVTFWLYAVPSLGEANGRTIPILEANHEPYLVEVRVSPAIPRAGNLHVAIVLRTLDEGEPVNDASVIVRALGPAPESLLLGPIETSTVPPMNNWYDFNIGLHQAGEWGFIADITKNEQLTSIEFSLPVQDVGIDWGLVIVLISAIPLIVAIGWYFRPYRRRGAPK